jgi:hypothetical protein
MKTSTNSHYEDDLSSDDSFDWSSDSAPKTKRKITKKSNHQTMISADILNVMIFFKRKQQAKMQQVKMGGYLKEIFDLTFE